MPVEPPTLEDVRAAAAEIAPHLLLPTPLIASPGLSELLEADVSLKLEFATPVSAFKVRGGLTLAAHLSAAERAAGLVTASTGNHGQSIAYAARLFDAPARPSREDLEWGAETFLCFVPMEVDRREARAILGFSWGFSIREAAISLTPPIRLAPLEWDKHHPLLGREHPAWAFASGYRNH